MNDKYIAPEMLSPVNLTQLAQVMERRPKALLIAGGVHVLTRQDSELFLLPPEVIFLKQVSELSRLTRNDRTLEIGACVTLQRLLEQAQDYLPAVVIHTLNNIANIAIRNQATIGGSLAISSYRSDLFLVLAILGAKVEIRSLKDGKLKKIKRIALIRLVREGFLILDNQDIIVSIRLPIVDWTHWRFLKLHRPFSADKRSLVMVIVARVEKGTIHTLHMGTLVQGRYLVYDYTLDAQLIGRKFPILSREIPFFQNLLAESLDHDEHIMTDYVRYTITSVAMNFLNG
ncbi:FAD binding domain-containing protein [Entomospira entomophila]|uniref:FAD-binding PCMH-type domain-containing protein n=1 Tax=Entomospira entomophila TaxID=2719988 RepID=A0A968G916_9SPIO|nr:FAD binding domain-containing protein [Entomospira entomophilus]NIZ40818.1 hypothetical protein [Entomospira entomophilus]WDI35030.1 FAD binding domain-containing protein [Entomospira entomophilus]